MSFVSCSSDDGIDAFKCSIYGNPKTLDPQTALNDSSRSVLYNIFEGLFTYDENGNITEGMIENYEVSNDGLSWTFKLKDDKKWSNGEACTADDYVFAFQRLFKPATKSERAGEYYIIKNAEAINGGKISDLSKLGVVAEDRFILKIRLEKPFKDFPALLALPPAMPCNRTFYESTEGRYGLSAEYTASNSGYYVHTWSYDEWGTESNYIILKRNNENIVPENLPVRITLFISPDDERKLFDDEVIHIYVGTSEEEISELKSDYSFKVYETEVWGIIFNLRGAFSNSDYRLALAQHVDLNIDGNMYFEYNGIIPEKIMPLKREYTLNQKHDSEVGMLSGLKLIMPEKIGLKGDISSIMQKWQAEQGFYCSLSELALSDYTSALLSGNFDIALVKLSGEYNSPYAYLNNFLKDNSENYSGYENRKFEHIMSSAFTSMDDETAAVYYNEAEQLLIESAVFIPLCIERKHVFYHEGVDLSYIPFKNFYK